MNPLNSIVGTIVAGIVLALIIVFREEGDLRWATVRRRLWLNTPRDLKTGEPRRKLWLWLIPIIILLAVVMMLIGPPLDRLWNSIFPFFAPPPGFDSGVLLQSAEIQAQLVGAWDFLLLFVVLAFFNIFGEEFLFRGVLLPKMGGTFGKWDWVVNGVLMGAYHWHQPWTIAGAIVANIFLFALPTRLLRIVHQHPLDAFFSFSSFVYTLGRVCIHQVYF